MELRINLYRDMVDILQAKIANLQSQGFTFEQYAPWEIRRKQSLEAQRQQIIAAGQSGVTINALLVPQRLAADFKMHLVYQYLDLSARIPDAHPRAIIRSSAFTCPPERTAGLRMLESDILLGKPLFPRLSRQIFDATRPDGMLFDWGVIHFHLGTRPDPKHPTLIEGHSEIAYAVINQATAYLLFVDHHGRWADIEILRLISREFPHLLRPYAMPANVRPVVTFGSTEHAALRRAGVNVMVEINGLGYLPPGGGINMAGGSMNSMLRLQQTSHWYRSAEAAITNHLQRISSESEWPWPASTTFDLRMEEFSDTSITVLDRANQLKVELAYAADRRSFQTIAVDRIGGT
ncbi:MAG: hypothetical protein ABSF77_13710 [Spirochaetia bacterium]|jgi:hypothetical protein